MIKSQAQSREWVVYAALAANLGVCAAKFAAALLTGSAALLSEGIHSLADSGNELLLLLGMRRSKKPSDGDHPYGYGKELYFWSLIVALVLFAAGGGTSIYEGVDRLLHPRLVHETWVNYAVIGVAFALESGSLFVGVRRLRVNFPTGSILVAMRRSKDPSVFTVVAEDMAAVAGLLAAFAGVLLSDLLAVAWCDALASILVGCILAVVAVFLASESRKLLVGESSSRALLDDVRRMAREDISVRAVGEALTMQLGPDQVLLNLDIEFQASIPSLELPAVIQGLEQRIRQRHPEITRIFVEVSWLVKAGTPATVGPARASDG